MPPRLDSELAGRRYYLLARQYGIAANNVHGWRANAAAFLGIGPSYLTKILTAQGRRRIGEAVVADTRARLNLGAYFEIEDDVAAHAIAERVVREGPLPAPVEATKPAIDEFDVLRALEALGAPARARVRAWLEARDARGGE